MKSNELAFGLNRKRRAGHGPQPGSGRINLASESEQFLFGKLGLWLN